VLSSFWSQSKRRAVNDEKEFWGKEWDTFKREVNRASDLMLGYEVRHYQETFFSINLAKSSTSQMELSGGAAWVKWMEKRANLELTYVLEELERRGKLDICDGLRGPVDISHHSWDLIDLSDNHGFQGARELRDRWGF
jgi:hypothetical protein